MPNCGIGDSELYALSVKGIEKNSLCNLEARGLSKKIVQNKRKSARAGNAEQALPTAYIGTPRVIFVRSSRV